MRMENLTRRGFMVAAGCVAVVAALPVSGEPVGMIDGRYYMYPGEVLDGITIDYHVYINNNCTIKNCKIFFHEDEPILNIDSKVFKDLNDITVKGCCIFKTSGYIYKASELGELESIERPTPRQVREGWNHD